MPPVLVRIRCLRPTGRRIALWLPVAVLYPLLLALATVATPLAVIITLPTRHRPLVLRIVRAAPQLYRAFCATRGARVEVHTGGNHVWIAIS